MQGGSIRLLHVDDDADFVELAATYLEREDEQFDVDTATSAGEGLERLAETEFDCVVSDYEMPRTDGIEFLEAVRSEFPDLPFILFTGKGSEDLASEAISAGVTDYLQKRRDPSQYELLANRITNAVEQARAERRARLTERQYRDLFENAPIMYVLSRDEDGQSIIDDCNQRFADRLGYDRTELVGRPIETCYTESSVARMYEQGGYEAALGGEFGLQERTLVTSDGERVEVLTRANPRLDEDGDPIGVQALYLDVTTQRERTRRLELALEQTRSGIWEYDVGSGTVARHQGAPDLWGEAVETTEPMSEAIEERVHPEDREAVRDALEATITGGEQYRVEFRQRSPDGYHWVEARGELVRDDGDDAGTIICLTTDITERKRRERELERYETIVESSGDAVYTLDAEGRLTFLNDAFCELVGYAEEELLGEHVSIVMDDGDIDRSEAVIRELLADDRTHETLEMDLIGADGERVACETHIALLPPDEDGGFRGTTGIHRDITERKAREAELQRYEQIVNTMREGACIYDEDGRFVVVNERLAEFYGTTPEALEGTRSRLLPRLRADADGDPYRELLDGEREAFRGEVEFEGPDGVDVLAYRLAPLVVDGTIEGVVGVAVEVTEQRERERMLARQNERLDQFASVVSHDLRNPLEVIDGHLELARQECDSEHLEAVARAHDRMDALLEHLLALAREGDVVEDPGAVDLAAVAEACWRNVSTGDTTLVVDTDATIRADRTRLQQLLENLVRNAVEHGGTDVTVTVGDLDDGRGFYVEDDGPGIPPAERDEVFEHGYSDTDDGTGFGLAIVERVADAHGWELTLTGADDGGARFEITGVEPVARSDGAS